MPHITIEAWPGRTPEAKMQLAQALRDTMASTLNISPDRISVSMRDVPQDQWPTAVVAREIADPDHLLLPSAAMQAARAQKG